MSKTTVLSWLPGTVTVFSNTHYLVLRMNHQQKRERERNKTEENNNSTSSRLKIKYVKRIYSCEPLLTTRKLSAPSKTSPCPNMRKPTTSYTIFIWIISSFTATSCTMQSRPHNIQYYTRPAAKTSASEIAILLYMHEYVFFCMYIRGMCHWLSLFCMYCSQKKVPSRRVSM